mgnify:CR=1 FL=1
MADFLRAAMSAFFGGDASQWERALLMPHYSAAGMPACSLHQVCGAGGGYGVAGIMLQALLAPGTCMDVCCHDGGIMRRGGGCAFFGGDASQWE